MAKATRKGTKGGRSGGPAGKAGKPRRTTKPKAKAAAKRAPASGKSAKRPAAVPRPKKAAPARKRGVSGASRARAPAAKRVRPQKARAMAPAAKPGAARRAAPRPKARQASPRAGQPRPETRAKPRESTRRKPSARIASVRRPGGAAAARPIAIRRAQSKTIVLFPEAAFGPALNCVGIAQALRRMGHNPVFVCDRGFKGVFGKYGFEENLVDMSGGLSDAEIARFWANFIAGHLPHFRLSPIEQLPTYVVPVWEAIVDSAIIAEEGLRAHLDRIRPDVVCVDNVVLFPAIKRIGRPWLRIISCSENEIPDPDIPPHLSGCSENDTPCFEAFDRRFLELVKPCHDRFNEFLARVGHAPYPLGQFFEASPFMNLMLYPKPLQFRRRHPLDPARFQYLEGCVRDEGVYEVPPFEANDDAPLVYVSFGSLGAADVDLYKRMIALFARLPCRFLMNVGDYKSEYAAPPPNVRLESWFPQPAVLPHVDLCIHHGGNNSFNEALYFGKPALIMPFCWDGLDNAARIADTGYGAKLARYAWTDAELAGAIDRLLADAGMHARLAAVSRHMRAANGVEKAARIIAEIALYASASTA